MSPSISVIIPLFNHERFVGRALDSIGAQRFQDYEVVVVNDGSSDEGPQVVRSFADPRVRLVEQRNAGVSAARNTGIAASHSDLLAFLDADDEWMPDHLETIWRLAEQYPQCGAYATRYVARTAVGVDRPVIIRGIPEGWEGVLEDYFALASRSDPPFWSSAVAVRKAAIRSVGGFPVGVAQGEDLLTWARLAARFPVAITTQTTAVFWQPEVGSGVPTRRPQIDDVVGRGLRDLLKEAEASKRRPIRKYVGLWHKMRGTMFLRLGAHRSALAELAVSLAYSGPNVRSSLYLLFALLPAGPGAWLARVMSRMAQLRRRPTYSHAKA